jgi:glycosyltransferase involved in cell wall biosynthesis
MGLETECRDLADSLGVTDSVRFAGFLNMEGKIREGSAADIYMNTNRIDNMPVSVLEAGAMGLPVVATRVGGIPHLLEDEQNALLVEDDDAESAAQAILRLVEDPGLAERLSTNGRILAERSGWEQVKPKWMELIAAMSARN